MKVIIADTYTFYIHNSKDVLFPKKYRNYKIVWDLREALLALWEGKITKLAIPKLGLPGYDYIEFIENMFKIGQIKEKPEVEYYELELTEKS